MNRWILGSLAAVILALPHPQKPPDPCKGRFSSTYEEILDAYFGSARGNSTTAVILRVYAGLLPEYEIVLDPRISTHKLFRYSPVRSISDAYDAWVSANPNRTLNNSVSRARKISFKKQEFDVSESDFNGLIARTRALSLTTCGLEPTVKTDGSQVLVLDAPIFEIILEAGKVRAGVMNTSGDDVVSPNPDLLKWALDVREHVPKPSR